jgi:hypothetical protein
MNVCLNLSNLATADRDEFEGTVGSLAPKDAQGRYVLQRLKENDVTGAKCADDYVAEPLEFSHCSHCPQSVSLRRVREGCSDKVEASGDLP